MKTLSYTLLIFTSYSIKIIALFMVYWRLFYIRKTRKKVCWLN